MANKHDMTPNPVQIGKRIQHVREDMGFRVSDLASRSDVSEESLRAAEDGHHPLPARDLLAVARALHWDWEALIEPDDGFGEQVLALFRKNAQLTPEDRLSLADLAGRAAALPRLTDKLKTSLGGIKPGTGKFARGNGREAAQRVRAQLRLGDGPLQNPFEMLRHYGVQLFRVKFSTKNLSGATLVHATFGAAVAIRHQDDLFRQCFSAMHEWGHVLLDSGEGALVSFEDAKNDKREWRANGFAAGMLLPDGSLKTNWEKFGENWEAWRRTLVDYRVNYGTLFYALADAGCFTQARCKELFAVRPPSIERAQKEDPDRLRISLGGLERLELYARLGVSPELADSVIERLRGEVPPSWSWVAEQLRLPVDALRELVAQPPTNYRQPLPTEVNLDAL